MPLSYAETQAILAALRGDMQRMIATEMRKQTGVVGGTYTSPTLTIDQHGKILYAADGGGGSQLLALYRQSSGTTIPSTNVLTIVNFNDRVFDADWEAGGSGYVTTGASWTFTAPADGWYLFHPHVVLQVDTNDWLVGDIAELYAGETAGDGFIYRFTRTALTAHSQQSIHMHGLHTVQLSSGGTTSGAWARQSSSIDRATITGETRIAIWKA